MLKILYLEDNKFDIELTRIELTKAFPDCKIKIENTVKGAKLALRTDPVFDIAILDLNLPDGNGIDTLIYLRRHNLNIAVIILTGSGNEESAIAALKAGADDYLTKKEGYLKKLPQTINSAIENFRKNIERRSRPLKVLYAEWSKPDIDFTKRHLQKYAPYIHVDAVFDATRALDLLPGSVGEKCTYDVLLLDYRLPGLDALETIKIIREERKLPIPIVMVTGHGNEDVAVQALKLGADEYLVKRDNYLFRLPSLLTSAFHRYELERQQKNASRKRVEIQVAGRKFKRCNICSRPGPEL